MNIAIISSVYLMSAIPIGWLCHLIDILEGYRVFAKSWSSPDWGSDVAVGIRVESLGFRVCA